MNEQEISIALKELWDKTLECDTDISKDFFENSGDSYKTTLLLAGIQKKFRVQVELGDLFFDSGFSSMISYIQNAEKSNDLTFSEKSTQFLCSTSQKNLFVLDKQYKNIGTTYNMPILTEIKGNLDIERFQKAVECVFNKEEVLRTNFKLEGNDIIQIINQNYVVPFLVKYESLKNFFENLEINKFDLEKDILIRTILIIDKEANKKHFFIDQHHIISDGVSVSILLNKIALAYSGVMEEITFQYNDFVKRQLEFLQSEAVLESKNYWIKQFSNGNIELDFPMDGKRKSIRTFNGTREVFDLELRIVDGLELIARKYHTTLNTIMFAAFGVLLYQCTKQEEFCVGTTSSGRDSLEADNILGIFINTLPIKFVFDDNMTFCKVVEELRITLKDAYKYQKYSYSSIIQDMGLSGNLMRTPLFDIGFLFQNMNNNQICLDKDLYFEPFQYLGQGARFEWMLEVNKINGSYKLIMEYNTDLYSQERIKHIVNSYIKVLEQIIENPNMNILNIEIMTEEDIKIIYGNNKKNNTEKEWNSFINKFYLQLPNIKKMDGVISSRGTITYEVLNERSNCVANYFIHKFRVGDVIGVMMNRNEDIIITYLAVMKAGCAFLPIDPKIPGEKIEYMLTNSQVKILLTNGDIQYNGDCKTVSVEVIYSQYQSASNQNVLRSVSEQDLAYTLYTSGSTGGSKGVMLEYGALDNFMLGMEEAVGFNDINIVLSLTTVSFDISLLELLMPILYGKTIVLVNEKEQLNDRKIYDLIVKYKVELVQMTPSRLKLFYNHEYNIFSKLKKILIGGEMLFVEDIRKLKQLTQAEIYNMYGPTETTIWSSVKYLNDIDYITAGNAIVNTDLYVLDKKLKPLPTGIPGELYIGGKGLARGYAGNEEETKKRFVFIDKKQWKSAPSWINNDQRLYRTGDLAKFDFTGELVILGRADNQIKLNGYRVELDDIRDCVLQCSGVENAAILCVSDQVGVKQLNCYYTADIELNTSEWNDLLLKKLPQALIPSYYIYLDELPLNLNGKVDYQKLREISPKQVEVNQDTFTKLEKELSDICIEIFELDNIGLNTNFYEVGCNSLKAIRLLAELEMRDITSSDIDIFTFNTIHKLSKIINKEKG